MPRSNLIFGNLTNGWHSNDKLEQFVMLMTCGTNLYMWTNINSIEGNYKDCSATKIQVFINDNVEETNNKSHCQ